MMRFKRGGRDGGGFRGNRGGGRGRGGGGNRNFDMGPPEHVVEVGQFVHTCENDLVCKTTCNKIPFFNALVYFENKEQIGKIDEIFGTLHDNGFSVKLSDGVKASSFTKEKKLFIDPAKLLPQERFLPGVKSANSGPRGARRGAPRGGRGDFRGGRGDFRGGRGGGSYRGNDRGGGGGFRGRGGRGGGDFRGGRGSFRGTNNNNGGFKRPASNHFEGGQNKKIKFDG